MSELENVQIDFNEESLFLLNLSIAFIMYGVSLDLNLNSFKDIIKNPKPAIGGIVSQFILLPALTFVLVLLMNPLPGLAMGMILVAACPGGNVSNFFTSLSKGNVALSVTLTIAASFLAIIFTPLNLEIWGELLGNKKNIDVEVDFWKMMKTISIIIGIPLVSGMLTRKLFPVFSEKAKKIIKSLSLLVLIAIIVVAFSKNFDLFLQYWHYVFFLVLIHNLSALLLGYVMGKITGNSNADATAIMIETGIQNSGLGLVIIFNYFSGQGGMALIAAWWGIWHIISGLLISQIFAYKARVNKNIASA
ncbi:bile acid:sodium symporter family protein [Marinigracilibium pacificum]|uniref:Bile acid:sodium symporter family protein n=1 Tax=Marinigracilibium pacificum TaxID=2729599 RepID=A0A848J3X6_9BACT|nr:bile acid:sodium symporter family protein [Marinigracilibium pacificum]NMM50215.1 bile acid:sodium symporter family protein [Marinigracilibium pacificum]